MASERSLFRYLYITAQDGLRLA
ncbi:MAG: hypothetical protein K0S65_3866, partial [Labilithrix sp.]|nr:hypothetical protein [Labilithrix sp.]